MSITTLSPTTPIHFHLSNSYSKYHSLSNIPPWQGQQHDPTSQWVIFEQGVKQMIKTKEGHVQTQRYCSPPGTTFRASGKALKSFQFFSLQSRYICVTISSNLEGSGSPTDSTWNHLSRKTLEGIQGKPEGCWNPVRPAGQPDFLPSTVLHMRQFPWQGLQKGFPHSWLTSDCHLSSGPTAEKQIIRHLKIFTQAKHTFL